MLNDRQVRALEGNLFPSDAAGSTYAVLDGAAIDGLLDRFEQDRPERVCLYRGELEPDLAQCAPYLVRLECGHPFSQWVLGEGWGRNWGIFVVAKAELKVMRRHFRTFLIVKGPDGKQLYFRYYDPRVLREYLPTCNAAETATLFGPIRNYACEGEDPAFLTHFWPNQGPPRTETIQIA